MTKFAVFLLMTLAFEPAAHQPPAEINNPHERNLRNNLPGDDIKRLKEISAWLNNTGQMVFNFWKTKAAVDNASDGFFGFINLDGSGYKGTRNSIQQARHLWAFCTWYKYHKPLKDIKQICFNQYHYLINAFYDPAGKEFYLYDRDKISHVKGRRLYNNSFCIYALSQYFLTFKDDTDLKVKNSAVDALVKAMGCFIAMDKRCHDSKYLGYQQMYTFDKLALHEEVLDGGDKENNTHIHIMEALTTLCEAYKGGGSVYIYSAVADIISSNDKTYISNNLMKRLNEMLVDVITKKLCIEKNDYAYIRRKFNRDWTVIDNSNFSFGHDIETAWLMLEALRVLGDSCPDSGLVKIRAKKLVKNVYDHGMTAETSGYTCIALGNISDFSQSDYSKDFWQQFEAILGLYCGVRLSSDPAEQDKYIKRIEEIIKYLDLPYDKGGIKVIFSKDMCEFEWRNILADEWKASYHSLRSLIYAQNWITNDIGAN
jgi:mannobiose 2-epimerase